MMKYQLNIMLILFFTILLSCSPGPEFYSEALRNKLVRTKKNWREVSAGSEVKISPASPAIPTDWWKQFNDPLLDQFIAEALHNNTDLKVRIMRVQESGLGLKEEKAARLPGFRGSASSSFFRRQSVQEYSDIITGEEDVENIKEREITSISDSEYYNTGLSVSWELDIWGRKEKKYLATKAAYEESKAQFRAEWLRIISDLAGAYFEIRTKDREKHILTQMYEANMKRTAIYDNQYTEGLIPRWKVMRQESESNEMEKKRSDLEQSRRKLENKIAILLGRAPGELKIPDTKNSRPPEIIQVPPGLPSELLANRPDIIAAEYRVEKAYHQIGEARAARLPSISLSGQAGFASATLSTLLQQWTLGLTPLINFPVFDGGASKIRVERNKIQADIAEKEYRQTVFRAFEEVENTLMELASRHQQKNILEKKRDILKVIYAQTDEKLQMGLITQQELMDIQREFLNTEKTLLETERSLLDNTVKLCKALGGGWSRSDIRDTDMSEPQYTEQTGESGRQDEKAEERKTVSLSDISPKVQIRRMRVQEIKG